MAKTRELEGRLEVVGDIQQFPSGFSKREFVVETQDGQYPQMIKFECVKERTSLTEGFEKGDPVKVQFDLRGNEYKGKYYVNLVAWKLDKAGAAPDNPAESPAPYGDADAPPSHLSEPPDDLVDGGDGPF
jgi:hypothetical protein